MADDIDELEHRLGELLANVAPEARVRIAHQLGRALRRSQANRIRANRDPDGKPFEPRKPRKRLRDKSGRIKRRVKAGPMFRKLGQAKALQWIASPDGVEVGFGGGAVQRIVRVHQFGLRDRVARRPGAPDALYPARRLLGLTTEERSELLDMVVRKIAE
jgi:phage virion morphogenesis protein